MLGERIPVGGLSSVLVPLADWRPYPPIEDRAAWEGLPDDLRSEYVSRGELLRGYEWPDLPATLFLEFARMGNRSGYEHVNHLRRAALRDLVLAECVEAQGRFLDDIANGIWTTCEETYWGYPAHVDAQRVGSGLPDVEEPTVDLFAAETAAQHLDALPVGDTPGWRFTFGAAPDRLRGEAADARSLSATRRFLVDGL